MRWHSLWEFMTGAYTRGVTFNITFMKCVFSPNFTFKIAQPVLIFITVCPSEGTAKHKKTFRIFVIFETEGNVLRIVVWLYFLVWGSYLVARFDDR